MSAAGKAWAAWTAYWFRPWPLFDLAVVRLVAVGFQLYQLAKIDPRRVFGDLAALPPDMYEPLAILRMLTLQIGWRYRPGEDVMVAAYWVTLAAGLLAFVGYRTTVGLVVFAVGNVFLQAFRYSFHEIHHPDAIVMIALGVLALAPAGGVLSLDDLRRRRREAVAARRFEPFDPLGGESRFARWPLLLVGIYLIQRAPFFSFTWLYAVFVPWRRLVRAVASRLRGRAGAARPVALFDGQCPLCIRSMTALRYADWLDRVAYVSIDAARPETRRSLSGVTAADLRRAMHVVRPDGSLRVGFFAVRELLRYLPPLWPLLPLCYLPGARVVGPPVYALVAARRSRFDPCTFEACALDDPAAAETPVKS